MKTTFANNTTPSFVIKSDIQKESTNNTTPSFVIQTDIQKELTNNTTPSFVIQSDIQKELTNNIINSIGDRILQYKNQIFNSVITKVQKTNLYKLSAIIIFLFVLSFIIPFDILIILNLIFTFIIIYKLHSRSY